MRGRKELLLFPPEDLPRLEYRARPRGSLKYEFPDAFTREAIGAEAAATRVIFAASINLTHPDSSQRDALAQCRPLHCTLEPGETLYLPAFWHHEVYSHAAASASSGGDAVGSDANGQGEQHLNVAVNFWFRNESVPPPGFE